MEQINKIVNTKISMDKSIDDKNISNQYQKWCSLIEKIPNKYSPTYKHSSYHYTNFL